MITDFVPTSSLLAACAAFLFAVSAQIQNIGLERVDPRTGTLITITTTFLMYWAVSPLYLETAYFWTAATLLFGLVGLFRPFVALSFANMGIKFLGPSLSSGLTATNPVWAVVFAIILLGETLTLPIALGTSAVVAGIGLVAFRHGKIEHGWPLWALLLPLTAALIRAVGHPVLKIGYLDVPSALYAGLVGYSVSFVLAAGSYRVQRRAWPSLQRDHGWFVLSGIVNGTGVACLNTALKLGQVLTVSPINACTPIFAILMGAFIFRREVLTWRIVTAIVVVVAGVITIVINSAPG